MMRVKKIPFIVKFARFLRASRMLFGILGALSGLAFLEGGLRADLCFLISLAGYFIGRFLSVGIFFVVLSFPLGLFISYIYRTSETAMFMIVAIWVIAFLGIWVLFRKWVLIRAEMVKQQLGIDDAYKLSDVPVLTVPKDFIRGMSGLERFARRVEKDPENPVNWLLFGITLQSYESYSLAYRLVKAPVNPIGTVVSVGIRQAIRYTEGDPEIFTPAKCHFL